MKRAFVLAGLLAAGCYESHAAPDRDSGGPMLPDSTTARWVRCGDALAGGRDGESCRFADTCIVSADCCTTRVGCDRGRLSVRRDCEVGCDTFCGGRGGRTCMPPEFCFFAFGCGGDDTGGVCRPRPDSCPTIFAPVCGCDRRTYGNECDAQANGVSILHAGECESPPPPG